MGNLWGRQPVMILATIQAAIALGIGFGLHWTPEQMGLVMAFSAAVLGLLSASQVTPMATLPNHLAAAVTIAANADVPKLPVVITPLAETLAAPESTVKPLFVLLVATLLFSASCASVPLKQQGVLGLQTSETALEAAQNLERGLCFVNAATERGQHCTNTVAAVVGLTDPRHVQLAVLFEKAFNDEAAGATALQAWQPGNAAPNTVASYQQDITAILTLAQQLLPGASTQAFLAKAQTAVTEGAKVAVIVGVKP